MKRVRGQLRIIGGRWRSRLVEFDAADGVRPTPDRVRQTLFDWLAPVIEGARCLDLFAGSGALGFEALSRGAAHVTFVEQGAAQLEAIRAAAVRLAAQDRATVLQADAIAHLAGDRGRYDIVFLDPPYDGDLLSAALARVGNVLLPGGRVYLEWRKGRRPELPAGYAWLKEKAAGQVSYGLLSHSELRA